jgi:hypothetical protein
MSIRPSEPITITTTEVIRFDADRYCSFSLGCFAFTRTR